MHDALVFTRTKHRADRLAKSSRAAGAQGRADSRQPIAVAAHRSARRVQERQVPGARGHRHRRARHRRHRARPRRQLRRADRSPRTTSTASAARRAPRRPARRSRSCRRKRRAQPAGDRAHDRQTAAARDGAGFRLRRRNRRHGWRSHWRSASPRSARARPTSGPARAPTPSAARPLRRTAREPVLPRRPAGQTACHGVVRANSARRPAHGKAVEEEDSRDQ